MKKSKSIEWRYDPYLERGVRERRADNEKLLRRVRAVWLVRSVLAEALVLGAGFAFGVLLAFVFTVMLLLFLP